MDNKLEPKLKKVYLHTNWLCMKLEDVSIQAQNNLYGHTIGGWGDITFRGVNRQFIEDMIIGLAKLLDELPVIEPQEEPTKEEATKK